MKDNLRAVDISAIVRPVVPMMGSDAAIDRTKKLIDEWTDTRTGCLETLAEWMMTRTGVTLDDGLNAMSARGLIKGWPNGEPTDRRDEKGKP